MHKANNKTVNIVIPNWNGDWCIKRCIDSLIKQTYTEIIITVVDNCSLDESISILDTYEKINLIKNNKNYGFATAINIGIKSITSDYVLILNNDTWLDSNFIEKALEEVKRKNIKILGFKEAGYESDEIYYDKGENYYTIDIFGYHTGVSTSKKNLFLCGVCLLFEKEVYDQTGGLDNNFFMYLEEVDWFWRLNLYQIEYEQSSVLIVHHKRHGSTGSGVLSYKRFLWRNENTLRMLIKNYSSLTLAFIIPIYLLISLFELVFFLIKGEGKVAMTYILGPINIMMKLRNLIDMRDKIQKNRKISDFQIFKKMYIGSAKLKQLRKML